MENETPKESRFLKVELGNYTSPIMLDNSRKEWVSWGKYNEYPNFLIDLLNYHPEHSAVVRGKSAYVFGKGLQLGVEKSVLESAKNNAYLNSANRYETWNELLKKTIPQYQLYNGWAWQIIWNNGKTAFETYHIEFGKLRKSKCGKKVFYCDAWMTLEGNVYVPNHNPEKHPSFKEFPIFNPHIRTEVQIFYYREDMPCVTEYGNLYPQPEYQSAIREIETDIEISKIRYNYAKWGMFAQSLISFFNGEPDAKEKKAIKKMFDRTYGGADNAGQLIFSFNDKGGIAPNIQTLTQSDLDKVFKDTRKECQDKIFSAHLAAPVLFGIKTEGSLSDTSGQATLKEWDKFVKTYIEYRQKNILTEIQNLAYVVGVDLDNVYFEQTTPVGLDLPSDPNILMLFNDATKKAYFAKKYGIELIDDVLSDGTAPVNPVTVVNENLKKLSGRDWQSIKRMIREVQNGKTTREAAAMILRNAYALTDQDLNVLFNTPQSQFSKFEIHQEDRAIALFEKFAIDDSEDEIVSEKFIDFHSHNFATDKENSDYILEALKGNPLATPESLAKQLGLSTEEVVVLITAMVATGLLLNTGTAYEPTQKAINKEIEPIEVETYTVYAYVTRPDVPEVETTSRKFCKRLLAMTRNGKRWTKEAIDNMENELGESAWTYRGGFYTNPNTQETTLYCRHTWKGITKSRKKKK
jgi:hypothetical protein